MKRSVAFTSMLPGSPVMTFASISFDDNGKGKFRYISHNTKEDGKHVNERRY